jgi:hypothetical protein
MANAADPSKNKHHTEAYRSEEDWWEENFGYGKGDPDRVGHYPGEPE